MTNVNVTWHENCGSPENKLDYNTQIYTDKGAFLVQNEQLFFTTTATACSEDIGQRLFSANLINPLPENVS